MWEIEFYEGVREFVFCRYFALEWNDNFHNLIFIQVNINLMSNRSSCEIDVGQIPMAQ